MEPEEKLKEVLNLKNKTSQIEVILTDENEQSQVEFISDTTEFLKKLVTKKEIEEDFKLIISINPVSLKDIKSGTLRCCKHSTSYRKT